MSGRRFGVEIECGIHNDELDNFATQYVRGRWVSKLTELSRRLKADFGPGWGDVDSDGTEYEIRSPILQGEGGIKQLREVLQYITELGGYVTEEDGMHVHHDAPEFLKDGANIVRLIKSWHANQDLIDKFCAEYRADWGYCPKTWNEFTIAEVIDSLNDDIEPEMIERGALNIDSLWTYGTIEIRQHEGCLDPDQAEAWVRFGQAFIDTVVNRRNFIKTCGDTRALLSRVHVPASTRKQLLSKAA